MPVKRNQMSAQLKRWPGDPLLEMPSHSENVYRLLEESAGFNEKHS